MASSAFVTCQPSISLSQKMDTHCSRSSYDHITLNSATKNYDCDEQYLFALKQIKRYLTAEIVVAILKHKDDLLVMGFSIEFIESLLSFGLGRKIVLEKRKCPEVNGADNRFQTQVMDHRYDMPRKEFAMDPVHVDQPILSALTEEEESSLAAQCTEVKKGKLTVLECKLCTYESKSKTLMVRHLGCHDNGKCFKCSRCSFTTPFRSKWNQHRCRQSSSRQSSKYTKKESSEKSKAMLDNHVATKHAGSKKMPSAKVFLCDKCPYTGRDLSSLADHQRKHTGDYLECTKSGCLFKTPYKRSLLKHLRQKHTTDNPLDCHICGIKFKHAMTLTQHMKRHQSTPKRYNCSMCTYASHSSTDVVLHLKRKHFKEKAYFCCKCSFQTGYALVLKKHLARHEANADTDKGLKPPKNKRVRQHLCSFCDKVFKSKSERSKHESRCSSKSVDQTVNVDVDSTKNVEIAISDPNLCTVEAEVFDGQGVYPFDSNLEADISDEVYQITSNMLSDSGEDRTHFTAIADDSLGSSALTQGGYHSQVGDNNPITACKGRNPMLAETTSTLAAERDDSPLLGESLLSLMSDFPRPPPTNRCQSATTLMFASLSPHLVDRSLTPDFFSDNPSGSFFV